MERKPPSSSKRRRILLLLTASLASSSASSSSAGQQHGILDNPCRRSYNYMEGFISALQGSSCLQDHCRSLRHFTSNSRRVVSLPYEQREAGAGAAAIKGFGPLMARGRRDDDDGDDDMELSVLEAEQARLKAELEAARLKAQLAKLQRDSLLNTPSSSSSSSLSKKDRKRGEGEDRGPQEPVSRKTGLQAAIPLSAQGPFSAARKRPDQGRSGRGWGGALDGGSKDRGMTSSNPTTFGGGISRNDDSAGSSSSSGKAASLAGTSGLTDSEKEARYVEVVEELVSALQDVSKERNVDIKTLVRGLKAAKMGGDAGLSTPAAPGFKDGQVIDAMRKGLGNTLVKRIIDGGPDAELINADGSIPSRLERLAAWGSLVEKTITSNKYLLTLEKVMGMRDLADRLLPRNDFGPQDITIVHLAIIREVGNKIADEYPEIRRRRGNMLYVLLNLPWGSRGMGNFMVQKEEIAIGQSISMESSLGLGCRSVFESTLAETMPSSTEALSLMSPEVFRRTARALLDFGSTAKQMLISTRMPAEEALKGISFFLIPWLRRIAKRALEDGGDEGIARLGMVMELGRYAAESMALVRGANPADAAAYEQAVQDLLNEKINGIGVELSSGARSTLLGGYIRSWVTECLMQRSLPVPWADGEGRIRPGDIGAWDLARQVLALSEMQLLYIAKETVPIVLGELMAEVFLEKGGEWPRGASSFSKDFQLIYRRLKCDKYEGSSSRCKTVRVMGDKVLGVKGKERGEELRDQAINWGCETMELGMEEFEELAREQATFELQTEVLEGLLGRGVLNEQEVADRIEELAAHLRLGVESIRKATTAAVQVHIGNLAARALFADMEGQPIKAFKEVEATVTFIDVGAGYFKERFGCEINPVARIADEDGLQLANICSKMISRRQFADAAKKFLEVLGYTDRIV